MIEVNQIGTVRVNTYLHVRSGPSVNANIIGVLYNGQIIHITKRGGTNNDWAYGTNDNGYAGWSNVNYLSIVNKDNNSRATYVNKEENNQAAQNYENDVNEKDIQDETERQLRQLDSAFDYSEKTDAEIIDSLMVNNLNGIYGIPYQFMSSVDPRLMSLDGTNEPIMGRKYSEKIISKMPLLCITPGSPNFLTNSQKREKTGIAALLNDILNGNTIETEIRDIINHNGKYFTFNFNFPEYFSFVNGLCHTGARFLNIQDLELNIGGEQAIASEFLWENALNKNLNIAHSSREFIGFYIDSPTEISESFTNHTTQSQLSNTVNGFSETVREMNFLLGNTTGDSIIMDQSKYNDTISQINKMTENWTVGKELFNNIASDFSTVAAGGRLLFPEIWQDSDFSRDYDFTIKLRTPDGDTVSWYLNIYVPLCHLIALVAGHQLRDTNHYTNGYGSPFLVRAYYKGMFNVDMGIITNMNIRKGKESAWNIDGLPTEIDVDITIKDLYNMLSLVKDTDAKSFVNNSILMDYIANTCGININQIDLRRSLEIYWILKSGQIKNIPNQINKRIQESIDNTIRHLYDFSLNNFLI